MDSLFTLPTRGRSSSRVMKAFSFSASPPGWFPAKFVEVLDERPLRCLEVSPAFPAHLRMKPASLGNLRLAPWVGLGEPRPALPSF